MFLKLFSIEWTRLVRRTLFWVTLAACALFIFYSQQHFYTANFTELASGSLKMPGFSFDLANSLDQSMLIALPFLVIIGGIMMGNDYSQRTNQHWLMRAPRPSSLLAKFSLLVLVSFIIQVLTLIVGGLVGWYFKTYTYHVFSLANVNWLATLAAPFYMTLVTLPYLALMLLVTILTRSTFFGLAIGLGYTQFIEILMSGLIYTGSWLRWLLLDNLNFSATWLLNSIGNKIVELPANLLAPATVFIAAAVYTLIFLAAALWLYQRQDLGG